VFSKQTVSTADVRRAAGLIVVGYAYLLAVLVGLIWGGVVLMRTWPWTARFITQFGFAYVLLMIEALWVRVPNPAGIRVTRAGSPRLIDEIEAIARRLDAPLPDTILLSAEFNAGAAELPRFGIFGPPKRYLLIGLPLLDALRTDEMRAVIGHELAHLSRRHGRLHVLVVRITASWTALSIHIASSRRYVSWLFLPFFRWYVPKLQSTADRLSRGHEHESDELAASATSAEAMAHGLVRMGVQRKRLTRTFLPEIFAETAQSAVPPRGLAPQMEAFFSSPFGAEEVAPAIVATLAERTDQDDDHPSLAERLEHLGVSIDVPTLADALAITSGESSTQELLGAKRADKLRAQLDPALTPAFTAKWKELRLLVNEWQDVNGERRAGDDAIVAYSKWATSAQSPEIAVGALRAAHAVAPENEDVSVRLGAVLLREPGTEAVEEAVSVLVPVAATESALAFAACALLRQAFLRLGDTDEFTRITRREAELRNRDLATLHERATVSADDDFEAARLSAPAMENLTEWLKRNPEVRRAFLVTKKTRLFQRDPLYVLALQRRVPWYRYEGGRSGLQLCEKCIEKVDVGPNVALRVMIVESGSRLFNKLRVTAGAAIFDAAPKEKLSVFAQVTSRWRRPRFVPSVRVVLILCFVGFPILAHFLPGSESVDSGSAESGPDWRSGANAAADAFGRHFVRLVEATQVDSVARLISATAREPDSVAWASKLVASVPHDGIATVERTMAFELREGTVTRDYFGYAIETRADTVTLILQTVEELGIRAVERAETRRGRVTQP